MSLCPSPSHRWESIENPCTLPSCEGDFKASKEICNVSMECAASSSKQEEGADVKASPQGGRCPLQASGLSRKEHAVQTCFGSKLSHNRRILQDFCRGETMEKVTAALREAVPIVPITSPWTWLAWGPLLAMLVPVEA